MTESPLRKISELYHEDAGFRAAADRDARAALAERGFRLDGPEEVRLAANSEETTYVVFPPPPNAAMPDGALDGVAGGWGGYPLGTDIDGVHYTPAQLSAGGMYDSSR